MKLLKKNDNENARRQIPLVQIPYDVEVIKSQLLKTKKQRKAVIWIQRILILLLMIFTCLEVFAYVHSGGEIPFDFTTCVGKKIILVKENLVVIYTLFRGNTTGMIAKLLARINVNLSEVLVSGEKLVERILVNITVFTVIKRVIYSNNNIAIKENIRQILVVMRKNIHSFYVNASVLYNDIRSNSRALFQGGNELIECLKIKMFNK